MATTHWKIITAAIADDPILLRNSVIAKTQDLAAIVQMEPGWTYCYYDVIDPGPLPRVIVFRPPRGEPRFGTVRVVNGDQTSVLWDVFSEPDLSARSIYMGYFPPACVCHLKDVDTKLVTFPGIQ
ncbi:hypothetical protein HO133_010234 [Letharia lupina]|uniref:Uncharacterized protein n=1 Tax=Letharia lupina TaxID=560253 RepID=A0A8H6CKR4_9LECA|nr:uncharacterized protein HO133_010234 [Letharia lupina]KAF6225039.1 hypothetical protein HO133_010234 [Letharia lupina]